MGGKQVERPARLLSQLRGAGTPLTDEAADFIETMLKRVSVADVRRVRKETAQRAREAKEAAEARAGHNLARFTREALSVLRSEAQRHDMPLEVYRGKRRGSFRWKGVYDCWGLAMLYGVSQSDLARFLRMDRVTVRVIVQRMKDARQISETRLASKPGSVLPGNTHHGVQTSESNIDT